MNLVTGGAGFIGSALVRRLRAAGEPVRVLDNFSSGRRGNLEGVAGVETVVGDVADFAACGAAARGVGSVFHLAAVASVPRSIAEPLAGHAAGATGTLNMLEAARAAGARRFVYASSCAVYGDDPALPKHEGLLPRPNTPYAAGKLAGEAYLAAYRRCHDLETVSLRFFNVFGPRQDAASPYSGVLAIFIGRLLRGEPCRIFGDGATTRDFVYVENVVDALLAARAAGAAAGGVYNVASGEPVSLNALYRLVAAELGVGAPPEYAAERAGDIRHSAADLGAARRDLGYAPRIGLRAGLHETMDWYRGRDGDL